MSFPALIYAAGFGTRMGHLTQDRPKPLIPVAGRPLIDHTLALAQDAGCVPIVANLHYLAPMLERHLHPKGVQTVVEHPDILETGGGLRNALPVLGGNTIVTLNSDAIWNGPNPVKLLHDAWDPEKMSALVMCVPPKNAKGHAGKGDFILSPQEQVSRGPGLVYGGIQIISAQALTQVKRKVFSLNLVWDELIAEGRMYGLTYPGDWCDVGHPEGIGVAETLLGHRDVS